MLYNQLHQGGIRALLDWDNTLFDTMVLPEDFDDEDGLVRKMIVDDIILRHGDTPLFIPEPTVMKYYINSWSTRMQPIFLRFYNAMMAEYNPIENYDRQEYSTHTTEDTMGNTRTLDTTNTVDGEINESGTDTTTQSGTDTTETGISAENVATFSPNDKTTRTPDLTTERTPDLKTENDVTTTDSGTITDDGSYDGSLTIDSRIHGNIGVTTSQQMLEQKFALLPKLDLIRFISDCWANEFCLAVY